ncbi:MAG: endonuclease/exonuclease/phosphatase family protein [Burkholderiales bacterium]
MGPTDPGLLEASDVAAWPSRIDLVDGTDGNAALETLPAAQPTTLRVLTLNMHKGFSALTRRDVLNGIRQAVRDVAVDVVFLQEVVGDTADSQIPANRVSQYEFLADTIWQEYAYGRNAVSDYGHHGNAVLSRYPIISWRNYDVSVQGSEPRGILHCAIDVPGAGPVNALCVHLGLREWHRQIQIDALTALVRPLLQDCEPVIVAGDFNDWLHRGHRRIEHEGHLREVHAAARRHLPRSFPAALPLLSLDRIYVSQVQGHAPIALPRRPWALLSDHAPLAAEITL